MNALVPAAATAPAKRQRTAPDKLSAWMKGTTEQELIGVLPDGRKVLWSTGRVRPITEFPPMGGGYIASNHYVLDWNGHAITAHCSGGPDGVVVQVMPNATVATFPLDYVQTRLRGEVVKDPVAAAELLARMRALSAALQAQLDTPDRQRGHI